MRPPPKQPPGGGRGGDPFDRGGKDPFERGRGGADPFDKGGKRRGPTVLELAADGDAAGLDARLKEIEAGLDAPRGPPAGDLLTIAALRLDEPVFEVLLDAGANPNATEGLKPDQTRGATALHVACMTNCWGDSMKHSLVFSLLGGGAHPIDAAIERGGSRLGLELLKSKGKASTYGQLHIRQALGGAAARVARLLLKRGAGPRANAGAPVRVSRRRRGERDERGQVCRRRGDAAAGATRRSV